jgi:hypothetical protein
MSADDVYWWANWVLVGALLLGVGATYAIVVSGNIKERALRRELASAGAAAETARANAAAATERAKALEKEAEQARLEQEKLKAQLAWRVLPKKVTKTLENLLARTPSKINIQHVANDPEALYLAIQFSNIFGAAGWQVQMLSVTMAGTVVFGIFIPDNPSEITATVRNAFNQANIGYSADKLPPPGFSFGGTIENAPILFIGSKPIRR